MNLPAPRKRTSAMFAGLAGLALCLSACGTSDESDPDAAAAVEASDSPTSVFPATIDTAYGEVTVKEKPETIVALSASYVELLPYLGETPTYSSEDAESLEFWAPWLAGAELGTVEPDLLGADWLPSAEAIAELEPDLILTDIWSTDEKLFKQLSQIAPTYVGIETDTQSSWQQNLGALASLTGHDPAVVDEVETELAEDFDEAAARLPGLQGASYVVPVFKDNQFWPTEYANDPIIALGLEPSEQQPHGDVTSADVDTISMENIDKLTEDVVFMAASGSESPETIDETYASVQSDPRVTASPATNNGTWLYLDAPQWSAINGGSPLSYRWWLEQVVPQLEESALNQSGQ